MIMAVIAMLDKKFDVRLKSEEMALLQTPNDILKHMAEK